jgi:hypothetical protein
MRIAELHIEVSRRVQCVLRLITVLSITTQSTAAHAQDIKCYAKDFFQATVSLETIVMPASSAAFSNYISQPSGFGDGAEGFGYHYGVSLADNVNSKFMRKFAFAAASHQRDNYQSLGGGNGFWRRVGNAALHTLFADPKDSRRTFNWSGLPASFAAAALSNAYQPAQQRTWSATFTRFGTNSAAYMGGDAWLEFTVKPRRNLMFRTLFKSH